MDKLQVPFIPQGILLDLDGTVVDETLEFSQETLVAIAALQKHIPVAICTGRSYAILSHVVLPLFSPSSVHIVAGGGQLIGVNGGVLWEQAIPSERVRTIAQQVEKLGGSYAFGQGNILYCSTTRRQPMQAHPWQPKVGEPEKLQDWSTPLLSIVNATDTVVNYIDTISDLHVQRMRNSAGLLYFDITARGVEKASAVIRWCRHYQLDHLKIAAVGDNFNDKSMLSLVGYPVVVCTAPPEILALAQEVIGTPKEGGVLHYLREVLRLLPPQ